MSWRKRHKREEILLEIIAAHAHDDERVDSCVAKRPRHDRPRVVAVDELHLELIDERDDLKQRAGRRTRLREVLARGRRCSVCVELKPAVDDFDLVANSSRVVRMRGRVEGQVEVELDAARVCESNVENTYVVEHPKGEHVSDIERLGED